MLELNDIIAACGHISTTDNLERPKTGTGYLIGANLVATCWHVVDHTGVNSITINFGGTTRKAQFLNANKKSDCAVLKLEQPLAGTTPLRLGGECKWKATWDSYGFPLLAKGAGVMMSGIVSNPRATDDMQADVLELTSPEVAAGMAAPLHGFSGSPVIVDGVVVGHLKRFLSDPTEKNRPAFGKVYATRSECVLGLLGGGASPDPLPVLAPAPGSPVARQHLENLNALLARWAKEKDFPNDRTGRVAAETLIQLGEPGQALSVLQTVSPSVRTEQLRALALAKTWEPANISEAVQILERLRKSGNFDAETGGLLGGRYKQLWQGRGHKSDLMKSHEMYLCTFETSGDPYPGINAAATALWLEDKAKSEKIARQVLRVLEAMPTGNMTFWDLATRGEALMLAGDLGQARNWYADAAARCAYAPESIATMQRQVALHLGSLGMSNNAFDDVFKPK